VLGSCRLLFFLSGSGNDDRSIVALLRAALTPRALGLFSLSSRAIPRAFLATVTTADLEEEEEDRPLTLI